MFTNFFPLGRGLHIPMGGRKGGGSSAASVAISNLVSLWSLDEASGTRVDAISAYDLTPTNTPGGAAGKVSTSTAFVSASSQELTRATAANLHPAGSFTAWGWIYETSIAAHGFVGVWEGGGKLEWQAWNAGTYWNLAISNDGTAVTIKDYDTYAPIAGEWHFGVFQYDAANSIIRIKMDNGRHQDFAYASGINSNNGQFRMGSVGGAAFHGGRLDEWGFAKRVLSLGEMSVIWNYGSGMAYPLTSDTHPQVVCDGDSIARGYGITTIAGSMPAQLEALSTSYHVVNIGTDGKRIADMVSDGATRVDVIKDTTLFAENVVICQAGTNDLYTAITDVYNNIVSYCQARQAAGWKVVVATILPRTEAGLRAGFETDRQTVNASIVSNWATFADALSDIGNDATIGQAASPNDTTYYSDKVHPTAAGNAIIAALHKTALDSI